MSKHYHFIGIGGIGMSALARILLSQKIKVTGSDAHRSPLIDTLVKEGAEVSIGHAKEHVSMDATVVYNSMIHKDHPEFLEALQLNCKVLHRSDLLKIIGHSFKTLAVSGTHGKTTTSSLLATVLKKAELDPAFALGGVLIEDNLNGGYGKGNYFVVEADESDASFLKYPAYAAIVTNIDNDHMDYYGTEEALRAAFLKFMKNVENKSLLFWCRDDAPLLATAEEGISYGFKSNAELIGKNYRQQGWHALFDVEFRGKEYKDVQLALIGKHQALNALAVFGLCISLGIEEAVIREAFKNFSGIKRRCEVKCDHHRVLVLDDYAHHPTEIETTLKGVRKAIGERRLIAVFQPHRYSRTKVCLNQLAHAFDVADELIVTDLYTAYEEPIPGIHAEAIVSEVRRHSSLPCTYIPKENLTLQLIDKIRPHDVLITLNAGDLYKVADDIGNYFLKNRPKKLATAVLYGGKSSEHEISLLSAQYILSALNVDLYDIKEFCLSKEGVWGASKEEYMTHNDFKMLLKTDIAIPIFHGPYGEDGTIQGFFDTLGIPYVGCDHRSSAICMDKALTKHLVERKGIKTADFVDFSFHEWQEDKWGLLRKMQATLHLPVFVKPTHLGSSIGISKVDSVQGLIQAIDYAFKYDTHVLVENGLKGREIEFCVLGNGDLFIPRPGEICTGGLVYDYEAKYGENGMQAIVPAEISEELYQKGREVARAVYRALGCRGLARVDFFLDGNGEYWLNEVNPIPGFTSISVYPKSMEKGGLSADQLLDRLIILALEQKRYQDRHLSASV